MTPVSSDPLHQYTIWVLYPALETTDPNLEYYYDFSQSLDEYTAVFEALKLDWHWQPVLLKDAEKIVSSINSSTSKPLVLNLCDGDETNGTPGLTILKLLKKAGLPFTGADEFFYEITTSKIPMKRSLEDAGVPTPSWWIPEPEIPQSLLLDFPMILKPAISGGSMGVSIKNVVNNFSQLEQRLLELKSGYRGWNLDAGGILAESFIEGREFTSFIVGSSSLPETLVVFEPVERVFHASLPENEKFLSFDRLWEIYEEEAPMPNNENFYEYEKVDGTLADAIKKISIDAYLAVKGIGYGRLDLRMDATGHLTVLEVNAQCGLSEDENFTSIGAILKASNVSFTRLIEMILHETLERFNKA
jgi:D-alanine-D-alanine ligase